MGKITNKHDREFHFRFNSLYEVYSFLSDVSDYVKNKEDPIYMEEIQHCPRGISGRVQLNQTGKDIVKKYKI